MSDTDTIVEITAETARLLGLTEDEFGMVCEHLGRTPNYTELGVYSVMWSEHCSYKNSIAQLKTLPRSGGRLLVDAGEENAGLVDIGNGYAIAFKVESHNHPSAVEPYQGAATGVGGILRDIFTMGARPIAAFDSLRFGNLEESRTRYLVNGVVKGIGDYGNSFGVPTVGGEVYFHDCYGDNPLVNAMAAGLVKVGKTASGTSGKPGCTVCILGARTGRDGIHGASLLASREFDDESEDMRPTVQVGDPFGEKTLLEAALELIESGIVVGMQDMGAAGISCSTAEMSAKGGTGMKIDLDRVPLREPNMTGYDIMLSESQERMLLVIDTDDIDTARQICDRWDVPITEIGQTTDDGMLDLLRHGERVAHMPAESLVLGGGAPVYIREQREPAYLNDTRPVHGDEVMPDLTEAEALEMLLRAPNIASKSWVYDQYDSMVRTNTVASFASDAAVLRIKELPGEGIALTTDCNSRYVYLNPYRGAMIAVAEAARNLVCTGAEPVAITNCLNFGNPYDPEIYYQFAEAIRGIGEACNVLDTPVTGGNVSFHNESKDRAVYPTPVIGMLGLVPELDHVTPAGFRRAGDRIAMIGYFDPTFGGSELLSRATGKSVGEPPALDLGQEKGVQKGILTAIREGLIQSAHDLSEGGLAVALAESSIMASQESLGVEISSIPEGDPLKVLYGETQSTVLVSYSPENESALYELMKVHGLPCITLGEVVDGAFQITDVIRTSPTQIAEWYESALPAAMEGKADGLQSV